MNCDRNRSPIWSSAEAELAGAAAAFWRACLAGGLRLPIAHHSTIPVSKGAEPNRQISVHGQALVDPVDPHRRACPSHVAGSWQSRAENGWSGQAAQPAHASREAQPETGRLGRPRPPAPDDSKHR